MDLEFKVYPINREGAETVSLKNGTVMPVTDFAMGYIYNMICTQVPTGHTVFRNYDDRDEQWLIEIFNEPRDYKNEPIWRGTFKRMSGLSAEEIERAIV